MIYKLGFNMSKKEICKRVNAYEPLLSMLKRLEWNGHYDGWDNCCPECLNHKTQGHEKGCELRDLLKETE